MAIDVKRFSLVSLSVPVEVMDDAGAMAPDAITIRFRPLTPEQLGQYREETNTFARSAEKAVAHAVEKDEALPSEIFRQEEVIVIKWLASLLAEWDLTSERQPLPIDKDTLAALPYATILRPIWDAIQNHHTKKNPT